MIDIRKVKTGLKLYHPLHGDVKFVSFHYGTCVVEAMKLVLIPNKSGNGFTQDYIWVKIVVMTRKLEKRKK